MTSNLSRLCLGTATAIAGYGLSSGHHPSHAEFAEMFHHAIRRGVRHFDTGAAYSDAEDQLVAFMEGSEKWWPKNPPWPTFTTKLAPWLVKRGVGRRGTIFAPFLLHNPTVDDLRDTNLIGALLKSCAEVQQGEWEWGSEAIAPGASVYTPAEAREAIKAGLKVVQIPHHALDQRHAKAGVFRAAKSAGVTLMARQPWARGLLLGDPKPRYVSGQLSWEWYQAIEDYQRICAKHGLTPLEAGLRFSLESPADLVVFGCSSLAQLEADINIAESDPPATWPACYAELRETFQRSALTLASVCTPEAK